MSHRVAERYFDRPSEASIRTPPVRFNELADLDEKALGTLIKETAKLGLGLSR